MPRSTNSPAPAKAKSGPDSAPVQGARRVFSRNLQAARLDKGWSQSDLARHAFGGGTSAKGRDNISGYERGLRLPTPVMLRKLCDALGTSEDELLPSAPRSKLEDNVPAFDVRASTQESDKVFLRVNRTVSWDKAVKIMQILKDDND